MKILIGLIFFLSCVEVTGQPSYLHESRTTIATEAKKSGVIFRETSKKIGSYKDIDVYKVDINEVSNSKTYSAVYLQQNSNQTVIDFDELRQIVSVFEMYREGKLVDGSYWVTTKGGFSVKFLNRNGVWEATLAPLAGPGFQTSLTIKEPGEITQLLQLFINALGTQR